MSRYTLGMVALLVLGCQTGDYQYDDSPTGKVCQTYVWCDLLLGDDDPNDDVVDCIAAQEEKIADIQRYCDYSDTIIALYDDYLACTAELSCNEVGRSNSPCAERSSELVWRLQECGFDLSFQ